MRKLSETEIQTIKYCLDRLQIMYIEIYDELLDHYISELEKRQETEFSAVLDQLNEAFTWSVVKKMEKNLQKNAIQQVAKMQWEALKFWNLSFNEVIIGLSFISMIMISFFWKNLEGVFISLSMFSLIGIILTWKIQGKGINFSLFTKNQKPVACISKAIIMRLGLLYGCMSWALIDLNYYSDLGPVGNFLGILLTSSIFFYIVSLIKVAFSYKKPNLNTIISS